MNVFRFLAANWDSVLVFVISAVGVIALIAKKQYAVLDKIVFALIVEAERKFGSGTGAAKLAAVVDWLYPRIPAIIRLLTTEKQIESLIERVLAEAQKKWNSNGDLAAYIKPASPNPLNYI